MTDPHARRRVAIVGGGVGGLFAALALSDPRLEDRFEVTVYSRGWRLGGKCASGRNPAQHDRIEEHGLHLWFGFYDNALQWTKRCLDSLPEDLRRRYRSFDDAFSGIDDVLLYEEWPNHEHAQAISCLQLRLPPDPDRRSRQVVPTLGEVVRGVADVLAHTARGMFIGAMPFGAGRVFGRIVSGSARLVARMVPRQLGAVPGARPGVVTRLRLRSLLALMGVTLRLARLVLRPQSGRGNGRRRQICTGLDLLTAALRGILEDRLLEVGFGTIDGVELRQWLASHGAQEQSLGSGSVLWALYDLVFGYQRGDSGIPGLAAGRAMLALLRLLGGYQGHFGYRMASSMGEVVIAPMYDLLRSRSVHFAFFRDLRAVRLDGDGGLRSVELHRQADIDVDAYDPFAWTGPDGPRHWPIEPDWDAIGLDPAVTSADMLENGLDATPGEPREMLVLGENVDDVILAVPAPVLADPAIHEELVSVPKWRRMLDHSASVATIAYQVWADADGSWPVELNGRFGSGIVSSYDQPFSTYCPMDQLAEVEHWNGPGPVRIGYGCGVWPEQPRQRLDTVRSAAPGADAAPTTRSPSEVLDAVQLEAARSLDRLTQLPMPPRSGVTGMIPRALRRGGGASPLPPRHAAAVGRHDTLWVRINDAPAHRYVTTPPLNPWFRIDPGDTGVANLYAAGDWTSNLLDGGCVEATVISALRAVRAVARKAEVPEAIVADAFAVVGERSWLSHGGRGGPPPSVAPSAWEAPARAGALTSVPGPYASDRTTLYAWLAEVDPERAATVARRCFADATGGAVNVEPIGSLCLLTAGDIADVSSLSPAYRQLGRLGEKQVVVWLPCHVDWRDEPRAATPPGFVMFVPYVWVDNPMSLTTGREGLGWPKAMARFHPPGPLTLPLDLSVYGLEHYRPAEAVQADLPLLSIVPVGDGGIDAVEESVSLVELAARLTAAAIESFGTEGADAVQAVIAALRTRGLPQLFAKSMISASDDARDDFLQVVTARATIVDWRDAALLGPCELVVHDIASHPVQRDLGLSSQTLSIGFRIELDFRQESGQVRWSSWASPRQRSDRARAVRRRRRASTLDGEGLNVAGLNGMETRRSILRGR